MPKFRTFEYTVWRACERFGILPPHIESTWKDCHAWGQALLVAYNQIREVEENEQLAAMAGVKLK